RPPDFGTHHSAIFIPAQLVGLHALMGDFTEAERIVWDLQVRLEAEGQPTHGSMPESIAPLFLLRGEWARAERFLTEALGWATRVGMGEATGHLSEHFGSLHLEMGAPYDAESDLNRALAMARGRDTTLHILRILPKLATAYLRTSRSDEANESLAAAREILGRAAEWGGLPAE